MLPHFTDQHPNTFSLHFHNLPTQCSISGSTNAILSTLLWGTSNIFITKQDFSKIIPGIFALLCLDGGHTMQEVLSAICLISNFYYFFVSYRKNSSTPITCFNTGTIVNLYSIMKSFEFLPEDHIIREITESGEHVNINAANISRIIHNINLVYKSEYDYNNLVLFILTYNRKDIEANGGTYYRFWTDTERFMNMIFEYMIEDHVYAASLAYTYPDNEDCQREIDNGNFNGSGFGSRMIKNIKNKKLRMLSQSTRSGYAPPLKRLPSAIPRETPFSFGIRMIKRHPSLPEGRMLRSPKVNTSPLTRKHPIKSRSPRSIKHQTNLS